MDIGAVAVAAFTALVMIAYLVAVVLEINVAAGTTPAADSVEIAPTAWLRTNGDPGTSQTISISAPVCAGSCHSSHAIAA